MWRAGVDIKTITNTEDDDDWETDPDFVVSLEQFLSPILLLVGHHRTTYQSKSRDGALRLCLVLVDKRASGKVELFIFLY
jgi:hypothetical protein